MSNYNRCCLFSLLVLLSILVFTISMWKMSVQVTVPVVMKSEMPNITIDNLTETSVNDSKCLKTLDKLISKFESLARSIHEAKQHVRGTKTTDALNKATTITKEVLKIVGRDWKNTVSRTTFESQNVCPEKFMGYSYGSPYYETGHVTTKCKHGKLLRDLLSIVIVYDDSSSYNQSVNMLLSAIRKYDNGIHIVLSLKEINPTIGFLNIAKYGKLNFFNSEGKTMGTILNNLLLKVKTPYVLIGRNLTWFNKDARLQRLILEIERLNVSTAGGASRDVNGRWIDGCQQRAFRNHTLVFEAGYDESVDECIFCDQIDGPFVMKTEEATQVQFNEKITKEGLFEDFFLRLNQREHVVCPDSMFFINRHETSLKPDDWRIFAKDWDVKKIKFSGKDIDIPCPSTYSCGIHGGALTPCCHKEQSDLVNTAMNTCEKLGVVCELDSGTLLGVLKLHTILPWEVDADTFFVSLNYSILNSSKALFSKAGYTLRVERPYRSLKCCYKNTTRPYHGYFALWSSHWRLEYNGMPFLTSERNLMNGFPPTVISLDGNWVRVPRNPGLVARNMYGKEIYQHSLHGSQSHIGGYPKFFLPCKKTGNQACLDRYNVDGNLQFGDPIP